VAFASWFVGLKVQNCRLKFKSMASGLRGYAPGAQVRGCGP